MGKRSKRSHHSKKRRDASRNVSSDDTSDNTSSSDRSRRKSSKRRKVSSPRNRSSKRAKDYSVNRRDSTGSCRRRESVPSRRSATGRDMSNSPLEALADMPDTPARASVGDQIPQAQAPSTELPAAAPMTSGSRSNIQHATPTMSEQGPHEKRLLNALLASYNTLERPVANESDPLEVKFGLTLQQIIDVEWNDYNLRWNDSEYGGVKDLRITPNKLWKPDVLMYNRYCDSTVGGGHNYDCADEGFDGTYQTNVVVRNNGSCLYVPPGIFKSTCKIDITWFPFDDQHCDMKFGSWTYDGNQLDLVLKDEAGGDLSDFITNGEWYLIGMPGKKNTITYACCPEPYVDVTFTIMIRRRTLYYFFNLIVPCVLISSMALLGFTLPPDSGEKLTLGVTILLSLTVFLNLVAEKLPSSSDAVPLIGVTILLSLTVFLNLVAETLPQVSDAIPLLGVTILLSQTVFSLLVGHVITKTSEAIPLIGTYFNCIMFMVASSVVLTVVVLNYHHRTADIHEMPQWIKTVFLQWLPWILRMSRPGKKITRKTIMLSNRMRELELKERSSKSLLANVLDIDDDFRHAAPPPNSTASTGNLGPGCSIFRTDFRRSFVRPSTMEDVGGGLGSHHRELHLILRELQFITARMKKADEEAELISDWKFAAMVVDRFCLFVFTLFTIIATVAVLLSAPHIIVQ